MKQKIFIGSSGEALKYAKLVKKQLCRDYDCIVWNENYFDLNTSTYENLYRKAYGFDFAIFVGGKDSIVHERGEDEAKVRDNVVFELGLYAGILSSARTFFLLHEDCKIFSDFQGITVSYYTGKQQVKNSCAFIREHIERERQISRPSALPATAFAATYFENFIKNIQKCYSNKAKFSLNGITYDVSRLNVSIKIVLPKEKIREIKSSDSEFYRKMGLQEISVSYEENKRGVYLRIDGKELENDNLIIYDVPTILDTSFQVVDLLNGKNCWGDDDRAIMLKKKEVREFEKTLMHKAQGNLWLEDKLACIDMDSVEDKKDER